MPERRRGDAAQRKFELRAAIAALGGEYVAREALRVDAHQRRSAAHAAVHQGHGAFLLGAAFDAEDFEWPETRGKLGAGHDADAGLPCVRRFLRLRTRLSCFAWHRSEYYSRRTPQCGALHRPGDWLT